MIKVNIAETNDGGFFMSTSIDDRIQDMIKKQSLELEYQLIKGCSNDTLKELIRRAKIELKSRK